MSFQVTPKAASSIPFIDKPAAHSDAARASREKAIAAFMGGAQQSGQAPNSQPPQPTDAADFALAQASAKAAERAAANPPVSQVEAPPAETTEESGQAPTTEAATSQQAKVEEKAPLSQHYATLARKEQALRNEVKRLNAERAAFKAEREAAVAKVGIPAQASSQSATTPPAAASESIARDRLLNDPMSVFEELGISSEDLAQKLLNHQPVDSRLTSYISKLEDKIAKLETSQDEIRKTSEARDTNSYEQAVTAIRFEAEELINSDPDFATIKTTGQTEEVVNLIKEVHANGLEGRYKPGTLLTVEAAARLVEDELVAQWVEQHEKLSRLEKIQKRINKPATTPVAKPGTTPNGQAPQQSGQIKTLSNTLPTGEKKLSARERAIAVFNNQKS